LAESTGFPPAAAAAAAAAAADDDDDDDVTGVEVAGLRACTGVDADVLTTDDVLAVVDGGLVTDVGALPCSDTKNNNRTSVHDRVLKHADKSTDRPHRPLQKELVDNISQLM